MPDFTKRAKKVIDTFSHTEAIRLNSLELDPEHILLALLRDTDSIAMKLLSKLGVNFEVLKRNIDSKMHFKNSNTVIGNLSQSRRFNNILNSAEEEMRKMNSTHIGTEHLLLALFNFDNVFGIDGLLDAGITYEIIKEELEKSDYNRDSSDTSKKNVKSSILKDFASDLTEKAGQNLIDPVIGREMEIDRLIRILSRKTKNNPVLIGEAGVGKTAVVEGLALRIVEGKVPELLSSKHIYALDLAGMVAGTKYRGEFEDRFKKVILELKNNRNSIIFIDELHTITGAGAAEGALDAANIIKPFLARSEIQCIGATTLKEYRKYIEKDPALERRFQVIVVKEPDEKSTYEILKGVVKSYENHHKVKYTNDALMTAIKYSVRYIRDRYLPDKAIDLIDEAGAKAKIENFSLPPQIQSVENEIEELITQKKIYVENQDFESAALIRDKIGNLKSILNSKIINWQQKSGEYEVIIDKLDILKIISQWTNIPFNKVAENEHRTLLNLETEIKKHLIGQDHAVATVCRALRRSRAGLKKHDRPIGSFIFTGPTGVGKTELVKVIADILFGEKSSLIRIDMSEYMEKHAVSRLIGSPPGYIGYDEGGQLTDRIKRNPYSIVLFDEIEKAHHDIFNILLQILDEGELTDGNGLRISFRDCIIVMTSNIGNTRSSSRKLGFTNQSSASLQSDKVADDVKKVFSPEFINRLDEIVVFNKLETEDIRQIASVLLKDIANQLHENKCQIEFDQSIIEMLVSEGYSDEYGVRYMKRIIQQQIEDMLSDYVLSMTKDSHIRLYSHNGKVLLQELNDSAELISSAPVGYS